MDPSLLTRFTAKQLAKVLRDHAKYLEAEATRLEGEVASARSFSLASIRSINDTDVVKVATEIVRRLREGDLREVITHEVQIRQFRAEAERLRLAAKYLVPGMSYNVRYKDLPYKS